MSQGHGPQFERAINSVDLKALGDPERWGGAARVTVPLVAMVAFRGEMPGPQFIRVQTPDLRARSWDLTCNFALGGLGAGDVVIAGYLEVSWGAGQATGFGRILCNVGVRPLVFPGDWDYDPSTGGTFSIPHPIPAATIAVRPVLAVQSVPTSNRTVTFDVTATVAPRALQ